LLNQALQQHHMGNLTQAVGIYRHIRVTRAEEFPSL
jgi:hypothetical protein